MKIISIIINKNWEAESVLNAMLNSEIRPPALPFPEIVNTPKDRHNKMDIPRAVFILKDGSNPTLQVKIWCIQDLMYFNIPSHPNHSSSSSEEKYRLLPPIITKDNPCLVIAVGTAGYPSNTSLNGSIIIGANFFIHDGHPGNPKSNLNHPDFGKILRSNVSDKVFDLIGIDFKNKTEPKFIRSPRNPSNPVCAASKVYSAISSVNVTDYSEYNWVDHEAIMHFKNIEKRLPFNSLETTHGVIRLSTDKPILFVSGISDRLGHFDTEVTPTQNYVASFNAGVVLGELVVKLNDLVIKNGAFDKSPQNF